jgi:aldehyde dehydrogenase (NAD+)
MKEQIDQFFSSLGWHWPTHNGDLESTSPIDGSVLGAVDTDSLRVVNKKIQLAKHRFEMWQDVPHPRRGELIRIFGNHLRRHKSSLAYIVSAECGKIIEEAEGEVQEMIDICDFAVGLSRQLHGLTIASERPQHVMHENWLPLGPIGVISAFNFPVAVWAWNFALAIVCGDTVVWKPSEKTPICALACQAIFEKACEDFGDYGAKQLNQIVFGGQQESKMVVGSHDLPLISATGSCKMGKEVAIKVAARYGKSLLELGGNNAVILAPSADLDVAIPSIVFGAVGTTGQRCTTTRRLFVHESIYKQVVDRLTSVYLDESSFKIGNPLDRDTLVGPLIDRDAYLKMWDVLNECRASEDCHRVVIGGDLSPSPQTHPDFLRTDNGGYYVIDDTPKDMSYYVNPAMVLMKKQNPIVLEETFAPILYIMEYDTLDNALEMNNAAKQGLSSAIFTTDLREAEYFKRRSDCGIANVNIGTSGAEIGGAFGGEKETGGGRESGSDAWKNYMRRQTSTTYYGKEPPPLAQGIKFDINA